MGGANTNAVVMINKLYPLEEGDLCEIKGVDPQELKEEEENCKEYGDEDDAIDKYMDEVWNLYDLKAQKFLSKKQAQQFLKDALMIFAMRKGKKPKDLLGDKKEKDCLNNAFSQLAKSSPEKLLYDEFKDFVNMADLNDIMELLSLK